MSNFVTTNWEKEQGLINDTIYRSKQEIKQDVLEGIVPRNVPDFSALHDYVDANEYGGMCEGSWAGTNEIANKVQNAVAAWIRSGGLNV